MSYNNNPDAKYKDPDYLYQEFIINNKSVEQIAQENNVTKKAVTWQLYTHGIKKNGNKFCIAESFNNNATYDVYFRINVYDKELENIMKAK